MAFKLTPEQLESLFYTSPDYVMVTFSYEMSSKDRQYGIDWGKFNLIATAFDPTQYVKIYLLEKRW